MRKKIDKLAPIFYTYILSEENGIPFYVGKGYNNRMYDHEKNIKKRKTIKNNHLYYKISKILADRKSIIYKKILENVNEIDALKEETNQILKIGRADLGTGPLCNLTNGGEGTCGCVYSIKEKERRSKSIQGEKNPMFSKKHTLETKRLISEKKKKRDACGVYFHTEKHKENLKKFNPGGIKTSKPIYQIDITGNVIKKWESVRAAAKGLNLNHSNISEYANHHHNWKVGGFFWKFV